MSENLAFPLAFAFEIALDWEDPHRVCEHYCISQEKFEALKQDETFRQAVQDSLASQRKEGVNFQEMAQIASHHAIKVVHRIAQSVDTPESIRLSAAQTLARWAGYGEKKADDAAAQPQIPAIQMFFGSKPDEVDVTPVAPALPEMEIQ